MATMINARSESDNDLSTAPSQRRNVQAVNATIQASASRVAMVARRSRSDLEVNVVMDWWRRCPAPSS